MLKDYDVGVMDNQHGQALASIWTKIEKEF